MEFKALRAATTLLSLSLAASAFTACGAGSGADGNSAAGSVAGSGPTSPSVGIKISRSFTTDALVFNGTGVWSPEEASIENLLQSHGATFTAVTSDQLNQMSLDDMSKYGTFIFPGGEGGSEAGSLSVTTRANIRAAVQQRGVSYIGFCAGSFIAVAPAPAKGQDVDYGIGVVDGKDLGYYYLESTLNPDTAMVAEAFPDGSTHNILWYGGPVVPTIPGGVLAKYPNGDTAVSEMYSGNGFVLLSGTHPTATTAMLDSLGMSPDTASTDIAWSYLNAAIHAQPLAAFN